MAGKKKFKDTVVGKFLLNKIPNVVSKKLGERGEQTKLGWRKTIGITS